MASFRASDGTKLSYWDIGKGPVCVLVHGFGMPAFLWLPFILPLASRYRFIMPNQRGFGGAHRAKVKHDSVFTQYAHDLHELLTHLKLEKPSLVGFSMGACTSMEYQRIYGFDNISAYLQVDQAMHIGHTEHGNHGLFGDDHHRWVGILNGLINDLQAHGTHRAFDDLPVHDRKRLWGMFAEFSATAFQHPLMRVFSKLARHEKLIRTVAPTSNWPVYLDCMRGFVQHQFDYRQTMSNIPSHCPVWFFVGDESKMYPAEGQILAGRHIAHSRVVRFKGAGHAVMFDSPVRFVRKLDEFLLHSLRRSRRARLAHKAASRVMAGEAVTA